MPKAPKPDAPTADHRPLVDRILDRVRNNPVAAVVILAALALGGLASLTDSLHKLRDLTASFGGSVDVAGEWKSELADFNGDGPAFMRLTLHDAAVGQVVGDVAFSASAHLPPRHRSVVEGRRDGKTLTLVLDGGAGRETLSGDLSADRLRLVYQRPGQAAVATTAQRIPQAPQRVAGRQAIVYGGKEFADPAAACTQMLRELDPPQVYKLSEPPDGDGNVRCAGRTPQGQDGFDQFQNEVQQRLVCPAGARLALASADGAPGCECDGDAVAAGGACQRPG